MKRKTTFRDKRPFKKPRYVQPYKRRQIKPSAEKKSYDLPAAAYQANTTAVFTPLCIPVTGDDIQNRTGRKVSMKNLYIRGIVQTESSAAFPSTDHGGQLVRMIVFLDKQPTPATALVATDILNASTSVSHLNLNNRERFQIIADKQYSFDPYHFSNTATQSYASTTNQTRVIKLFKTLKDTSVVFNATNGGTVADITSGALYMMTIGNIVAGTNNDGNFNVTTRVRFTDQ